MRVSGSAVSESVTFLFANLQRVRIKKIDAAGFVYSRLANAENQNEYKVKFWMDGSRKDDWFYEFELEPA